MWTRQSDVDKATWTSGHGGHRAAEMAAEQSAFRFQENVRVHASPPPSA